MVTLTGNHIKNLLEDKKMSESYFKRIKKPVSSPEEAKPILKETKTLRKQTKEK